MTKHQWFWYRLWDLSKDKYFSDFPLSDYYWGSFDFLLLGLYAFGCGLLVGLSVALAIYKVWN